MKLYYKAIIAIAAIIMTGFMASCSSDSDENMSATRFEQLKFNVEVTAGAPALKAASDNKTGWTKGDKIIFIADNQSTSICQMEFDGKEWQVSKLSENPVFAASGKIKAVFSDNLTYTSESNIRTKGDILYTEAGKYAKKDDIVCISLNMSERPISKIRVNGVGKDFYIDGLKEFSTLDITTMSWSSENLNGAENREIETGNNSVFYGLLPDNGSGKSTITLANENGEKYTRTYDKKMGAGEAIVINGPLSEEKDRWAYSLNYVTSITLNKTSATVQHGDTVKLIATVLPENASKPELTWTCSNNLAEVKVEGGYAIVTAKNEGNVTVTATATDGSGVKAECHIKITPIYVTSITLSQTSLNLMPGEKSTLTASFLPNNADKKQVRWSTSNSAVAEVDATGQVIAKTYGTAIITATATDGSGVSATCSVTVKDVDPTERVLGNRTGQSTTITSSGTYYGVTWTIVNNYPKTVHIVSIAGNTDIARDLAPGESTDITLYGSSAYIQNYMQKLIFTVEDKQYEKQI